MTKAMEVDATQIRFEDLPERRVAVRRHDDGPDTIESTRRPMYQHMIMHELVGGPSVLRFRGDDAIDVLIGATCGFEGDDELRVEILPAGRYAVADFEGPVDTLAPARRAFLHAVTTHPDGTVPQGDVLQVHLMDEYEGETEQQFQVMV